MKYREIVRSVTVAVLVISIGVVQGTAAGAPSSNDTEEQEFEFPTSENDATFRFTSVPDIYNWNIAYPQPGWEDAMDWFLNGMKTEGPAFTLNAGDIMDARWWSSKEQVRRMTDKYWGGFRERFEDKNIDLYIAPGDHEYGDDQGLTKMHLHPAFGNQFAKIFDMPQNGPSHKKGRAYSFTRENLAVISTDQFEDAGDRLSKTVTGKQLDWFKRQLKKHQDRDFLIVQGHHPVVGPVASKNSSANMLEGGTDSGFWQAMVEYGVDVYLAGEHHRVTVKKQDGIWQVVHGALWGTQDDPNYLRGSVWPDRLKLELFRFNVNYGGGYIGNHPHRGSKNRPREKVSISEETLKNGPRSIGELVIKSTDEGNKTVRTTGEFFRLSLESIKNDYNVHSRKGWGASADSVSHHNNKVPSNVLDGDLKTRWHSKFKDEVDPQPHHLVIDMKKSRATGGIIYVPRQDNSINGTITKFEVFVSDDPESLGEPVKSGTFEANRQHKVVRFDQQVTGRYLILKSHRGMGRNASFASAGEVFVLKP